MFNKLFKFLKGYVIIRISGSCTERFFNICTRRNIDVSHIEHCTDGTFTLCISKKDFKRIRSVARKTKTEVRIIKKRGLYNLIQRYGKRYFFIGGAAVFLIFLAVMSQFIWIVEINGVYDANYEQILQILADNGVYGGALKCRIPEGRALKSAIINNTENVSWAWVYIEGAKARVEIYEKALPPEIVKKNEPCDIIAACDAFVENIDALEGEKTVPNGNGVEAGDVLISGTVPVFREGYEPKYIYVHAMGRIRAVTYHEKTGDYKEYHENRIPTGRHKSKISAEIFGKLFRFYKNEAPDFEEYDVDNIRHELCIPYIGYTGIALNIRKCKEVQVHKEPISTDTAVEFAKHDLEEKIANELFKDTELKEKKVEFERLDSETIRVTVKMTCIEDIGIERKITDEGVNMLDKPTD